MLPHLLTIWIGKILLLLGRIRGGGSSLPGLVVEKLQPNFIQKIDQYFDRIIVVTGTNGKTTTTKMLKDILQNDGKDVVTNSTGSNMPRGIITSVISAMNWSGGLKAEVGLFETDEGFTTQICQELNPDILAILNLHRDQLDRYGELDRITGLLKTAAKSAKSTVVNFDDLKLKEAFKDDEDIISLAAAAEVRNLVPSDDLLHSHKQAEINQDTAKPPDYPADVLITLVKSIDQGQEITLKLKNPDQDKGKDANKTDTSTLKLKTNLEGVFNSYNIAAAVAAANSLGVSEKAIKQAVADFQPAFGRSEAVQVDGKELKIILVKNPSGFNQAIASFLNKEPLPTLIIINDNYADGRDISWLWDVDIESWQAALEGKVIVSGIRAHDMALRLQYADIEATIEPDIKRAVAKFIEIIPEGGRGNIVPTYTAMLETRKALRRKASLSHW